MKPLRWVLLAAGMLAGQGCASPDRWIDCESHLEPINTPAPVARDQGARPHDKGQEQAAERIR